MICEGVGVFTSARGRNLDSLSSPRQQTVIVHHPEVVSDRWKSG